MAIISVKRTAATFAAGQQRHFACEERSTPIRELIRACKRTAVLAGQPELASVRCFGRDPGISPDAAVIIDQAVLVTTISRPSRT